MLQSMTAVSVFGAYVAGSFRQTGTAREIRSPFDQRAVACVHDAGSAEIEEALAAAEQAFPATRALSSQQRANICAEVASGLAARRQEIALAICDEAGKPISDSRAEVDRAVFCFELAAAEAPRSAVEGELLPMDLRPVGQGRLGLLRRVPIGPIAAISPFNFPLNLAVHKVAPALAVGCPIVLKPASQTPTPVLRLAEIIQQTAWPKGALSVLPAGRQAADRLVSDDRPQLLTFTGSAAVGWDMKARAGRKRVVLELGGNAAVLLDESIHRDDLDDIVGKLVYGAFSYAGQKCISVQRIYIVARDGGQLADEFTRRFLHAVQSIKCGDPRDPDVLVGPMIDAANAQRIERWAAEAQEQGAQILAGGTRKGNLVPPIVLTQVPGKAQVASDEAFGPLCLIERVPDFSAGIAAINASRFGLQAAVFTRDLGHSLRAFDELVVGAVILNDAPSFRLDHMPYGGVKESGHGREGLRCAIADMTEPRLLVTHTLPPR
jgi:acyl-CoA reductase-like NAD-dependent aldehyde dehydrogenase